MSCLVLGLFVERLPTRGPEEAKCDGDMNAMDVCTLGTIHRAAYSLVRAVIQSRMALI